VEPVEKVGSSQSSAEPASPNGLFAAMVDLCPLGLMLSSERKILSCNTRFASMFGYTVDSMLGKGLAMLYPSDDEFQRIGERGLVSMMGLGEHRDERLMRRRDGALQWFRVHGHAAELYAPFKTACWVFEPLAASADASSLTPREREVLAGITQGYTAKQAAKELGLSPRTVEALRARLRARFGAHNAAELMGKIGGVP
jgi:PAS domain S-box-containing protein